MAVQQISYDLIRPEKDYDKVIEAIKNLGTSWAHPLRSVWWVETNMTSDQVSDAVKKAFDGNDIFFVNRLRAGEYQGWLSREMWEWLNTHA